MCTLTLVPISAPDADPSTPPVGVRLVHSRDEQRDRPEAEPPEVFRTPHGQAVMPLDPPSGGTWAAAAITPKTPLLLAILNVNPEQPIEPGSISRGTVIPELLEAESLKQLEHRARALDLPELSPFHLVATDGVRVTDLIWQGGLKTMTLPIGHEPRIWVSSGLGDHIVRPDRQALFDEWFSDTREDWPDEQDALHQHHWPDRGAQSILMARHDARTTGITAMDLFLDPAEVSLSYTPVSNDRTLGEPSGFALQ